MTQPPDLNHQLQRLKPWLLQKYGVKRLGYFDCYLSHHHSFDCELNILVELEKPLGWEFFSLKEFLETKLNMRIDICTPRALKPALAEEINQSLHYV